MSTSPKRLAALASAAVVLAGVTVLAPPAAQANPAGTDLVISEVYGAGGNSGSVLNADFVELFNPTDDPIDLLGTYVSYRSPPVAWRVDGPARHPRRRGPLPDPDERRRPTARPCPRRTAWPRPRSAWRPQAARCC